MRTLIILPTLNEAETIVEVLTRAREALPDADALVVDDGSVDGTADLAEKADAELGGIQALRRDRKRGLGDAYRAGFTWGLERGYDVFIQMDSDLSHDPAVLPALVAGLDDHDMMIGSRYVPGGSIRDWGRGRRLLSKCGNLYSSWMLGVDVHDLTAGFRAYRSSLVAALDLSSVRADGYGFQVEIGYRAAQMGARIAEVPICFVDRRAGQSKMSSEIVVEALLLVTAWGLQRWAAKAATLLRAAADPRRAV